MSEVGVIVLVAAALAMTTFVVVGVERARIRAAEHDRRLAESRQALDEAKNTFLCAVSHEMRTPLTAIVGFASMIETRKDASPDEVRDWAGRVAVNTRRLQHLLGDLLDLDRFRRGVVQARRHPTDVHQLVEGVLADIDSGGHPIAVDVDAGTVVVDTAQVERVVENLVVNAVHHTPPGTPIWVRADKDDDGGLLLVVEDAGPGIPDEEKDVIFEPLRQGGRTPQPKGAGIGLSLVAGFARLHGGRAWVEDREGGGASFKVLIPPWGGSDRRVLVVDWDGACHLCERSPETIEVAVCAGPGVAPILDHCPLVAGGVCDQARTADAIAISLSPGADAAAQLEIAKAYRANYPEVPVIIEVAGQDLPRFQEVDGCKAVKAPVTEDQLDHVLASARRRRGSGAS